ncbi:MAG: ATP-binding protein [Deltaproteobacteria bacterium]|nr:ATP-binding protein [Deltaproteobacteria bacterium]
MSELLLSRIEREHARFAHAAAVFRGNTPNGALADAEAALAESLRQRRRDPFAAIAAALDLTDIERDFLAAVTAATIDPRLTIDLRGLQGGSTHYGLELATYCVVARVDAKNAAALSVRLTSSHPLLRDGVLISRGDGAPASRAYRLSDRVATYLMAPDSDDMPLDDRVAFAGVPPAALFDEKQHDVLRRLGEMLAQSDTTIIVIEGTGGSGRRTAAATVAASSKRRTLVLDLAAAERGTDQLERGLTALRREIALTGALPVIAGLDELTGDDGTRMRMLVRFLEGIEHHVVVTTSVQGQPLPLSRRLVRLEWPIPISEARREMWAALIGDRTVLDDTDFDELAQRYRVGPGAMAQALDAARLLTKTGALDLNHVVKGMQHRTLEQMGGLATRVTVRQTWDDLVLSPDTRESVDALVSRVRHAHHVYERWGMGSKAGRATGVAALFSGPPGTGKTMVAGLIAGELGLDLQQVDLSQVVSKWMGETEKNLSKLFDSASNGNCLLLFDEADSLFTKRTEVKSSNDRNANMEVNYLLQRIEAFGGVTVLTTNLDASIDPAFKRRLAAHVVFWPPDDEERAKLWRQYLDGGAPVADDVDHKLLAEEFPDLSGAHIRNAVLAAAFAAAGRDTIITQAMLESASRSEYGAMGRVLGRNRK